MKKFIFGCFIGGITTFLLLMTLNVFTGGLYAGAQHRLINDWRTIAPGMTKDEVIDRLGKPNHEYATPRWAAHPAAEDFQKNHKVLSFYIGGFGPHLLLVFLDQSDRVAFVSSANT